MASKLYLSRNDSVLQDVDFLRLGFEEIRDGEGGMSFAERARFDRKVAVDMLVAEPDLGARLLGRAPGSGTIYWSGEQAGAILDGRSLGVRIVSRREGEEVVGDNVFGRFLTGVRDAYRELMRTAVVPERPVDEDLIVTDFTPRGAAASDIEMEERGGKEYIHTDIYRPARFRFDASLNGTTGHAQRESDADVEFHRFECPFGTSYPAPLIVESAAEASMLYERAIRGEIDWVALLNNLSERGLLNRNLTERERQVMAREYRAQFDWMREQIATDRSLRERPIVAASRMIPDDSMGRSIYDADHAPSPAHILARYIQNPALLYSASENGVIRALNEQERAEPVRLQVAEGTDELVIVVAGSDTIGGREPGERASSRMVKEMSVDKDGNRVITSVKRFEVPMKTKDEIEADYAAFAARMDEILQDIPEGTRVRLVSGNSATQSSSVGLGTPRMVERYVREKGGEVAQWDYVHHRVGDALQRGRQQAEPNAGLSAVLMEHFGEVYPVLVGHGNEVSFLLDPDDPDSDVTFRRRDGLVAGAGLCFSVRDDANNRNVLALGTLAASEGLPVIHVRENRSENDQQRMLWTGSYNSRAELSGESVAVEHLFALEQRRDWDMSASNVLSFIDGDTGIAVPFVSNRYPAGVSVGGYTYSSAYGAYAALLAIELGKADNQMMIDIRNAEGSTQELAGVVARIAGGAAVDGDVQERCLRRSVRMMAEANVGFADTLAGLDGRDVVMPVAAGLDMVLFTDLNGEGLNRFGMVLRSEAARLRDLREAHRVELEAERSRVLEEAARRQRVIDARSAPGEKVAGGFPARVDGLDAVWFMGTNTPQQFVLPDEGSSFDMWDDLSGDDRLVRAKAESVRLDNGEGGKVDNNYVFIFPTDLGSVTGRRRGALKADSTNLTDCTRVDPKTGEKFVCAYGVPVRFNNMGIEPNDKDLLPCSYRLDNDSGNYSKSLVLADSQARVQALRHGMALCCPGHERANGESYYTLGQVFMDKRYTRKDGWADNPHRAPLNYELTMRYMSMLEKGADYPLNFIPLPADSYTLEDPVHDKGVKYVSGEGRFISDLNLALRIANATALALGVPLRFPLDENNRIDLGPGVPEGLRVLAERKIDSFIGVVNAEDIVEGELPYLGRMNTLDSLKVREGGILKKADDIYLRPNDLAAAFGGFDFTSLFGGGMAPLHEMMFCMDDDFFFLVDTRLNRGMDLSDINKYLSYEKNDQTRFRIMTNNPDRVKEFKAALLEYIARSKGVEVQMRLVREGEKESRDQSLSGFVNLLDSNSEEFVQDEHDVGREATVYNALGRVNKEGALEDRNVSGDKNSGIYYGRTDARDGFAGYAQIRFSYNDGPMSEWRTVDDLDLAKDIVMTLVNRKYSSMDERVVPSEKVMEMLVKAEAMKVLTLSGRIQSEPYLKRKVQKEDSKVVTLEGVEMAGTGNNAPMGPKDVDGGIRVETYDGKWTRRDVQNDPARLYVFTDNTDRDSGKVAVDRGSEYYRRYGDGRNDLHYPTVTAAVIRGLDNAMPVSTQRFYHEGAKGISGRWQDSDAEEFRKVITDEFDAMKAKLSAGGYSAVVFPGGDGLFNGEISAINKERVPVLYDILKERYEDFLSFCKGERIGMERELEPVREFQGEYRFLSNFWDAPVICDGELYPSVENAYQAAKCADREGRKAFLTVSAAEAKRLGKGVALRNDWEEVKDGIMLELVRDKFTRNPKLAESLLLTEGRELVEGNRWGDTYWGVDLRDGSGENRLGHILMTVRDEIASRAVVREQDVRRSIVYSESSGAYQQRTRENATADDVDFTLAFAVDFTTFGERATAKAAGDSIVQVDLPMKKEGGLELSKKAVAEAVKFIRESLPEEYFKSDSCGLNIAGNGLYTLAGKGVSQDDTDKFVVKVMDGLQKEGMKVSSIRTGGQTGVDESGAVAGVVLGIPTTVHAPKGWAFRGADNKDVKAEAAFKGRFEAKDYQALRKLVCTTKKVVYQQSI